MRQQSAKAQRKAAEIAARQHGVVSYEQLLWTGFTPSTISRRMREGWLHRIHRGVYAIGNPNLTREGHWMAAVLACGEGAVLSHESAAVLWGISPSTAAVVHVTVWGPNGRRKRKEIVVHRSTTLTPAATTRRRSIPVTTHARTLTDLGFGPEPTRSGLERAFLSLCRRHGISKPEVNVRVGPHAVDFLWREERLIVETDGWRYHSSRAAFEADRARDRELKQRGHEVLRFTDREVAAEEEAVAASVLRQLRRPPDGRGQG